MTARLGRFIRPASLLVPSSLPRTLTFHGGCRAIQRTPAISAASAARLLPITRFASTKPEEPIHQLRKLIIDGRLDDILVILEKSRVPLGKPEIRDILCRIGDAEEGHDLSTPDVRSKLIAVLTSTVEELGFAIPDATLISRAGIRVPWTFTQITDFIGQLRANGVKPTAQMYENFMKSLLRVLDSEGAEHLLVEMERDGVRGTTGIYGVLSELFVAKGKKEALERLLGER